MSKLKKNQQIQVFDQVDQYIPYGSLRKDGTFTQKIGQGSGSHHGGVKITLYAKKSQIIDSEYQSNNESITKSVSTLKKKQSDIFICQKCQNKQSRQQQKQQKVKRQKIKSKVSLRDTCRTRNQKKSIYEKVNKIFQTLYKDQYQMVSQQIDDQILLLMNSICHLYDQLQQSNSIIKSLQNQPQSKVTKSSQINKQIKLERKSPLGIQGQLKIMIIQNQQLYKKIQKLHKQKQKLNQKNKILKVQGKQIQKVLKKIQPKYFQNLIKSNTQSIKTSTAKTKQSTAKNKKNKNNDSIQNTGLQSFSFFSDDQIQKDFTIEQMIKKLS